MKRYIFFVVFLMITPLANAQNEILRNIFPQVADGYSVRAAITRRRS